MCKTFNGTTVRLTTNYLFHKRNILILTLRLVKVKLTPPSTLPIRASLFKHASGRLFEVKIQVKQHATKPFESCMPTLQRDLSIKTYNLDKRPGYCSSVSGILGDLDCLGFGDSIYAGLRVIVSCKETPNIATPQNKVARGIFIVFLHCKFLKTFNREPIHRGYGLLLPCAYLNAFPAGGGGYSTNFKM